MGRRTAIGNFIHTTWTNLNIRCGKYKHLQTRSKCIGYENISLIISREEFKKLCEENKSHILSLNRPSIDRIDKLKDYTLDNIQFIELSENIIKDKTVFKNDEGVCSICKSKKYIDEFAKDKRRKNGRSSICKQCDNKKKGSGQ